jgi:hypothetical protein
VRFGPAPLFALTTALLACQSQTPPIAPTESSLAGPAAVAGPAPAGGSAGGGEDDPGHPEQGSEGDEAAFPSAGHAPMREVGASGVVGEVLRELSAARETTYTHHTTIDESRCQFDYDCSGFVDYALEVSAPDAFGEVRQATVARPLAKHFVAFLASLPPIGTTSSTHWASVARVTDLQPGDVIAWLRPVDVSTRNTGHVMFVHGPVAPYESNANAFVVPIADATHSPHGQSDARRASHASGLGTGTIVLLTDASGRPTGYKWSRWKRSVEHATTVALGRITR